MIIKINGKNGGTIDVVTGTDSVLITLEIDGYSSNIELDYDELLEVAETIKFLKYGEATKN